MWLSVSDCFSLACFQSSATLQHASLFYSFLWLNTIPLCVLLNKGSLPEVHKSQSVTLAFEKRKGFIERSADEQTGGKAHICLPDLGLGVEFKGLTEDRLVLRRGWQRFQAQGFSTTFSWTADLSLLKGFWSVLVKSQLFWFHGWE